MSKDLRRHNKVTGMDENKKNALMKIKEARLKGISGVQQLKEVIKFLNLKKSLGNKRRLWRDGFWE